MKLVKDAWLLAVKDLRIYVRDRWALCLGFLVPIALVTLFGWIMTYAFGGSSGIPKVTLWVVDEDQSPRSQKIIESLRASEMLKVLPREGDKPITQEQLRAKIVEGDAHHGVVFPQGYGSTNSDQVPELKMIRDPGRSMEDRMIQIALAQSTFSNDSGGIWRSSVKRMLGKQGLDGQQLVDLDDAMDNMQSTISKLFEKEDSTNEKSKKNEKESTEKQTSSPLDFMSNLVPVESEEIKPPTRSKQVTYQQAQSVAGMSVMMLLFGLTGASSVLIAERELGTLRRLFGLPIARESVLLGKFMFVFVIGVVQMLVLFLYGELMFRVGLFRDPLTTSVIIVTWISAACAFGMFIATFSQSAKQADSLATILILIMAGLGGCWFPLQMMSLPLPFEILTKSMLTYWAMDGLQSMLWNNLSLWDTKIQLALLIQWIWAIGLGCLATYFFRRNYYAG